MSAIWSAACPAVQIAIPAQLSVISSLQHLSLVTVRSQCSATKPEGTCLDLPSSLLSHLVQLTYLQLNSCLVQSDAALQHLHAVTGLQHLNMGLSGCEEQLPTAAVLTGLQHLKHLTALEMHQVPWAIDLHNMPPFAALTALRVLQLSSGASVDPAVLAASSQLQEVELQCKDAWGAEGSAALLAAIGEQPQLKRLELCFDNIWRPPTAAAYSALTASSHLQQFKLRNFDFPDCAWQQMFLPARCLPELRHLHLDAEDSGGGRRQWSPADMQAMVSCCPALASLRFGRQLAVSTAAPLQQLTDLTQLSMLAPFQDNAPSIARLTGLRRLVLSCCEQEDRVTVSGLLQLTVLQQLRYMVITGAACDPGLASSEANPGRVSILNKVRMSAAASGCCLQG